MTAGPGKYDDLCTALRVQAQADGAIAIVINGKHGNGFSCQATEPILAGLAGQLYNMAYQILEDTIANAGMADTWWNGLEKYEQKRWVSEAGTQQDAWAMYVKQKNGIS